MFSNRIHVRYPNAALVKGSLTSDSVTSFAAIPSLQIQTGTLYITPVLSCALKWNLSNENKDCLQLLEMARQVF